MTIDYGDGTYTIEEDVERLDTPGSELRLQPLHGEVSRCNQETVRHLAVSFAELIDVPIYVADDLVSQRRGRGICPLKNRLNGESTFSASTQWASPN